jgi:hypothetical protein
MKAFVIDTNVPVTANGMAEHADIHCVEACIDALIAATKATVLLDDLELIMDEYRRHLCPSGQPGPGDAFMKWLYQNQGRPECCKFVHITPRDGGNDDFDEFPDDTELATFDRSDRKFVAVAKASRYRPLVLNATDTDWWICRKALKKHGIRPRFLCPQCVCRD